MNQLTINETNLEGRLSFTLREDNTRPWWRDLDLDGRPLYRIGNICDTCAAMFQKQDDATLPLTPSELSALFRSGLDGIPQNVVDTIASILPKGSYHFNLLNIKPALIKFRRQEHYLWENSRPVKVPKDWLPKAEGINPWWFAQPGHNPGFQKGKLYEAALPLVSEKYLKRYEIKKYFSAIKKKKLIPTALALSVVDVRYVSARAFDWRLIHFILDGHHKMMAASKAGKAITLLSFLNVDESFAPKEWIDRTLQIRYK
jgi:hypothetical protein